MAERESPAKLKLGIPKWLKYGLGSLLVVAAFYFLISRLVRDWHLIPFDEIHFSLPYLALSYVVLIFCHFPLFGWLWQTILRSLEVRMPLLPATVITVVSNVGKYLPGKVWFTVGRMSFAERYGASEAKVVLSVVMEIAITLLGGLVLFAFAVLFIPRSLVPRGAYGFFALIPICLALLYPPVLNRLLAPVLRLARQPHFELRLSYLRLLGMLGICLLDWLAQGMGSYLLINSFYPLPLAKLPVLLGAYAISWMIGFLVLVAPAGLGVREGIYTVILKTVIAGPVAIITALVTRVWMTAGELIAALAGFVYLRAISRRTDA
jgi:hypothetical protein